MIVQRQVHSLPSQPALLLWTRYEDRLTRNWNMTSIRGPACRLLLRNLREACGISGPANELAIARTVMAKTDFRSVDEYIATQPEAVRGTLERVRATIRKALPKAEEVISYQIPAYRLAG